MLLLRTQLKLLRLGSTADPWKHRSVPAEKGTRRDDVGDPGRRMSGLFVAFFGFRPILTGPGGTGVWRRSACSENQHAEMPNKFH